MENLNEKDKIMNLLSLAIFLVEEIIKNEPSVAAELKAIFSKDTVDVADLAALRAKIASETYESLTGTTIPAVDTAAVDPKVIDAELRQNAADSVTSVAAEVVGVMPDRVPNDAEAALEAAAKAAASTAVVPAV